MQLAPGMNVNGHAKRKWFKKKKQEDPILFHTMNRLIVHLPSYVTGDKREQ